MYPELIRYEDLGPQANGAIIDIMIYRVPGGILYERYTDGDRCVHLFSPRPYVPGQAFDSTIESCVLALFYDYCVTKGYDPAALYRKAYPGTVPEIVSERAKTIREAMAEGVALPEAWNDEAFEALLQSLIEIGHHGLAVTLKEESGL